MTVACEKCPCFNSGSDGMNRYCNLGYDCDLYSRGSLKLGKHLKVMYAATNCRLRSVRFNKAPNQFAPQAVSLDGWKRCD